MKYFWKDKINVNIGYLWEVGLGKWEMEEGKGLLLYARLYCWNFFIYHVYYFYSETTR